MYFRAVNAISHTHHRSYLAILRVHLGVPHNPSTILPAVWPVSSDAQLFCSAVIERSLCELLIGFLCGSLFKARSLKDPLEFEEVSFWQLKFLPQYKKAPNVFFNLTIALLSKVCNRDPGIHDMKEDGKECYFEDYLKGKKSLLWSNSDFFPPPFSYSVIGRLV